MPTYAVGDVQGCHLELLSLLAEIRFDPVTDRLILVGDLVNRGPDSLEVLRLLLRLGDSAICLLGNHDLHLLAVAAGGVPGKRDTLQPILDAPDREPLLDWLRHRPLAWFEPHFKTLFVHAGLVPQWSHTQALLLAEEASSILRGTSWARLLKHMYGDHPDRWDPRLAGVDRTRFVINCLTRLRYCDDSGRLDLHPKGRPGTQAAHLHPWFQVPHRASSDVQVVFGHWSTLGQVHWAQDKVYGLDTGCIWGGQLTCLCLDDGMLYSVPGRGAATTGEE